MCVAARETVVQARRSLPPRGLDPEAVITPGIFVQKVVAVPHPAQEEDLNRANATYPLEG